MAGLNFFGERILFLGAHPDDIELGCGATLAQVAQSANVKCVTFSDNQKNPLLQNLTEEHYTSMAVLGVPRESVTLLSFETRRFGESRQAILDEMLRLRREFNPDLVFVHSRADVHQDHHTMTAETLRAFRSVTVLGYEIIRSSNQFTPSFFVAVSESNAEKKIHALNQYSTYAQKYYFEDQVTRAAMIRNGALCEQPFAEGFDILRLVAAFGK